MNIVYLWVNVALKVFISREHYHFIVEFELVPLSL